MYKRLVIYLAALILGFVISDLWRGWWNMTLVIPGIALVLWLRHKQKR
jgi:Ca2+-dependent lipid-binding protein